MTSKNENRSLNAEAQKFSNINSHWHLSYLRLKKNRYGMFGLYGVLFIFFIAFFAEFLSPHSYKKTVQDELYNPPQLIRFIDSEGDVMHSRAVRPTVDILRLLRVDFDRIDHGVLFPYK